MQHHSLTRSRLLLLFTAFTCLFVCNSLIGQSVDFQWGAPTNEFNFPPDYSAKDPAGNYLLKLGKKEVWAFNDDLELINKFELDVDEKIVEEFGFQSTSTSTNYLLLVKEQKGVYRLNSYDFSADKGLKSKPKMLHSFKFPKPDKEQQLNSIDSNYLSFILTNEDDDKREFELVVFDRELNKLWKKRSSIPLERNMHVMSEFFGSDGALNILVRDERKDKSSKEIKRKYIAHRISEEDKKSKSFEVKLKNDDWHITNSIFYELANGIAIADIVEGPEYKLDIVVTHFDASLDNMKRATSPLKVEDIKTVNMQCDEGCKYHKARQLDDLTFNRVIVDKSTNESLVTGSHSYTYSKNGVPVSKGTRYYTNIKLDPNGNVSWFNMIPIVQDVLIQNADVLSIYQTQIDDRVLMLFNDQLQNWESKNVKEFEACVNKKFRKGGLIALYMDFETGETTHDIILKNESSELVPSIKSIKKMGDGDYRLIRRWGKWGVKYEVGSMKFSPN